MQSANWRLLLLSFIAGGLAVLAFAPFEIWPLAFLSLGAYFYISARLAPKAAFFAGLSYGLGLYCVGVSWVYVSLSTYGGMPLWMGSIAVLGFAGLLALFIATASYVNARFFAKFRLLAWPFIWVVFEWLKSWVLTGFPWLDMAYTQTPNWLLAWAPVGGVYLVSFVVVAISSLLTAAFLARISNTRKILSVCAVLMLTMASWLLTKMEWSTPVGAPLQVGVIQANVPINQKWQAEYRDNVIEQYRILSHEVQKNKDADLIIWPETALPLYLQQTSPDFWQNLIPKNTALLTGIIDSPSIAQGDLDESYNAAVLNCNGEQTVYRKRHLVPFGEYLPLRFLFNWVLEYLQLPMSDFSSWQGPQDLSCGGIKLGLSICYEDAFANEYRQHLVDATVLVNISEDAWFGDSFAPHQRRQMAQMRASELSRPMVRAANSGPSLFINERGHLLADTAQFSVATLQREVQPHTGATPYKALGNWIIWLSLLVCGVLTVLSRRSR